MYVWVGAWARGRVGGRVGEWVSMVMVQEAEREMWEQIERERHEERDIREKTEDELAREREKDRG